MVVRIQFAAFLISAFLIPTIGHAQAVGTVQGYKVKGPGIDLAATPPSAETISVDGVATTNAQPYFLTSLSSGPHTISVTKPQGWSVGYTLCYNDTSCHTQTPTPGDSVSVNVPAGGYVDLWWHFTAPVAATGRVQGFKILRLPNSDTNQTPPAGETISVDGDVKTSAQPYFVDVPAGQHTITVSLPSNWSVGYTACVNSTSCHQLEPQQNPSPGASAVVDVPANGYVDLWWHFTPPEGRVQGLRLDANGNKTTLNTAILGFDGPFRGVLIGPEFATPHASNPYSIATHATKATIVSTVPEGFSAQYSVCTNCIDHPLSSFVGGNAVEVTMPEGGYVDMYWKYIPAAAAAVKKIVESGLGGYGYAYAPTIIKKDGTYHMFFCSFAGELSPKSTDAIRYVSSPDGLHWSSASIALLATGVNGQDLNACDPDVVFFNGYYYMYYSDTLYEPAGNARTIIQVARSTSINGSYLTYTKRGTWEKTPSDPQVLIYPLNRTASGYGAGQQQVVVRGNKLYMWYNDDSLGSNKTFMLESTDPLVWKPDASRAIKIPVPDGWAHSPDVKYDEAGNRFVMVRIEGAHAAASSLQYVTSVDGLSWSAPTTLLSESETPNFANNNGISADDRGWLLPGQTLVAFAAPYQRDRANDTWGYWDLYGAFFDLVTPAQSGTTPQPTATTSPPVAPGFSPTSSEVITLAASSSPQSAQSEQIQKLQKMIAELLNKIAVLKSGKTQTAGACPNIARNLSRGMRGDDVKQLQLFLIGRNLLTSDSASGFFGALTEQAVKKWQSKNDIVSSGSANTSGYGAVGPKTRRAITACL